MKRFLIKFILVVAPMALLLALVNLGTDTANRFNNRYEVALAKELLAGNSMTNVRNYKERLLQKLLVTQSTQCPEVLVLGSSRIMPLHQGHFPTKTFMNNGVSAATLEDFYAITELYAERGCRPRHVVLGLDHWTLNSRINVGQNPQLFLEGRRFLSRPDAQQNGSNSLAEKLQYGFHSATSYLELFSPSYLQVNLRAFKDAQTPNPTRQRINDTFSKFSDGSISYDLAYRSAKGIEVEQRVDNYLLNDFGEASQTAVVQPDILGDFMFFLDYLQANKAEVEFMLLPYHPKVFGEMLKHGESNNGHLESESKFREIAQARGIKVIGTFDPHALGLANDDFHDGQHCAQAVIDSVMGVGRLGP
jgi:hypothetical protein